MFYNLPPIIIYDEDKNYYYAALEKFDEKDDLSSMVEFFKYEMEKTWEKALDREYSVSKLPNKLSEYINNDNNIGQKYPFLFANNSLIFTRNYYIMVKSGENS